MTNNTNLPPAIIDAYMESYQEYATTPNENLGNIITKLVEDKDTLEDYWLGPTGKIREVKSGNEEPQYAKLSQFKLQQKTKKYLIDGFQYDREEAIGRNIPQYARAMRELIRTFSQFPEEATIQALEANGNAWDGVPYFSNKVANKRYNDNLLDGDGDTIAAIQKNIKEVRLAFRKFVYSDGKNERRANSMFDTILIPPELEDNFRVVLNSASSLEANINSGVINPLSPSYRPAWRLVVSDWLTDTNDWYAFDSRLKPMYWIVQRQYERGGAPVEIRLIDDDSKWKTASYIGVSASQWAVAAYGHPIAAIKVVNA